MYVGVILWQHFRIIFSHNYSSIITSPVYGRGRREASGEGFYILAYSIAFNIVSNTSLIWLSKIVSFPRRRESMPQSSTSLCLLNGSPPTREWHNFARAPSPWQGEGNIELIGFHPEKETISPLPLSREGLGWEPRKAVEAVASKLKVLEMLDSVPLACTVGFNCFSRFCMEWSTD